MHPLHSTLFILVQYPALQFVNATLYSTFHSVYISTNSDERKLVLKWSLHSTLFILVPKSALISAPNQALYIPLCLY